MREKKNQHKKNFRSRMAVLGDGRTEQFYLKHLKELNGYSYAIRPMLFDSINLKEATKIIKQLIKEDCSPIFYFTDYDTIVNQNRYAEFENFKVLFANKPQVIICETMPSIEFWFLLHYTKTTCEFLNAAEVEKVLKKHIPDYDKKIEYLENINWVATINENNKLQKAIKNAIEVLAQKEQETVGSHFPFTKIQLAINEFENQKNNK